MLKIYSLFSILITLSILFEQYNSQQCDIHKCADTKTNNICTTITPTSGQYELEVSSCPGEYTCNVPDRSYWKEFKQKTSISCSLIVYNNTLVDGEDCTNSNQCGSSLCKGGKCIGKPENITCTNSMECETGLYCDTITTKTCRRQRPLNSQCTLDDECVNWGGCYNKTCTEYRSLPPDTIVLNQQLGELFCNTSYVHKGKCATIENVDQIPYLCNNTCTYKVLETNEIITKSDYCNCGYNSIGAKYCQLGSNSISYLKYKEYVNTTLDIGCHVSKKYSCTDKINRRDVSHLKSLFYSWKGYFQLTDQCLINYYASSRYLESHINLSIFFIITLILFY